MSHNPARKLIPLLIMLALVVAAVLGRDHIPSADGLLSQIAQARTALRADLWASLPWVVLGGVGLVALSLPGMAVTVMAGAGLLLGGFWGGVLGLICMVGGSSVAFVLAHRVGVGWLGRRMAARARLASRHLNRGGITGLLLARVAPVMPYWLVNISLGLMGLRLRRFVWISLLGFAPGAFIYATAGAAVQSEWAASGRTDLTALTTPQVWGPLLLLTLMVAAVGFVRRRRGGP